MKKKTEKVQERHIGELIRAQFDNSNLSVAKFARSINTTRNNVYDIFKRNSIDTELLDKIGQVLNYDFFQYYVKPQEQSQKTRARVLIEMDLSDAEIIRLGLSKKIFE